MDCCSPDVGDCQKCHPEMWIQKPGSYCNWIPKKVGSKGRSSFNRTRSKHVRRRARTQNKRTV